MSVLQASDETSQQKNFASKKPRYESHRRAIKNYLARLKTARAPLQKPTNNRSVSRWHGTSLDRTLEILWNADGHTALIRFAAGLFRGRAPYHTVRDWRRGRRPLPHWACILLADYLAARITRLAALESELRQLAQERTKIDASRAAANRARLFAINQKKKPAPW